MTEQRGKMQISTGLGSAKIRDEHSRTPFTLPRLRRREPSWLRLRQAWTAFFFAPTRRLHGTAGYTWRGAGRARHQGGRRTSEAARKVDACGGRGTPGKSHRARNAPVPSRPEWHTGGSEGGTDVGHGTASVRVWITRRGESSLCPSAPGSPREVRAGRERDRAAVRVFSNRARQFSTTGPRHCG